MKRNGSAAPPDAPPAVVEALESAGLRYTSDAHPGYRREGSAPEFRYIDARGNAVDDSETLKRIARLAIPPAWQAVWICADARGHLQSTGRDARGRKQYRYHPRWREERDSNKFERLAAFAAALPAIRDRVEKDLALPGLPRAKVLAAMIALLDRTFVRVGDERYRRENQSYGLTTLRNRHVEVDGERIRIRFRGKGGKLHDIALSDRRLANVVRRCRDLPGYELFQYVEDGELRSVDAGDVNAYLKDVAGAEYSAKDFRTWGATVIAASALCASGSAGTPRESTRQINDAIRKAAERLGNTLAVCRKSYVHPGVLDCSLIERVMQRRLSRRAGLSRDEVRALALLAAASEQRTVSVRTLRSGPVRRAQPPVRARRDSARATAMQQRSTP